MSDYNENFARAGLSLPPEELEQQPQTAVVIVEPVPQQALVDKLSALVLLGKVDFYQAKDCVECEDWKRARRLIEKAE